MSAYADTSFLFSVYIPQIHSPAADGLMEEATEPILVTSFSRFELRNAIRLSVFRKMLDNRFASESLAFIARDISTAVLALTTCDWAAVHEQAERLSARYTITKGHRSMDLLHVASALTLGASAFLTFDQKQAELANAAGLLVRP